VGIDGIAFWFSGNGLKLSTSSGEKLTGTAGSGARMISFFSDPNSAFRRGSAR
jgi:hypothetical protein